jgi:hypothetical protein
MRTVSCLPPCTSRDETRRPHPRSELIRSAEGGCGRGRSSFSEGGPAHIAYGRNRSEEENWPVVDNRGRQPHSVGALSQSTPNADVGLGCWPEWSPTQFTHWDKTPTRSRPHRPSRTQSRWQLTDGWSVARGRSMKRTAPTRTGDNIAEGSEGGRRRVDGPIGVLRWS